MNLNGRLVEMPKIGGCLSRLLSEHQEIRVDQSERVNNNLLFKLNQIKFKSLKGVL